MRSILTLLMAASAVTLGQTTTELSAVADAYVSDVSPTTNFNNASLAVGVASGSFARYRSYLRFDLSGIPAGHTIVDAALRVTLQSAEGTGGHSIEIRRVQGSWSETGISWSVQPGASIVLGAQAVGTASGTVYHFPAAAAVTAWMGTGVANDGLLLRAANEDTELRTRTFASRTNTALGARPALIVIHGAPQNIALTPTELAFGNQTVGTSSSPRTVTILNTGELPLTVAGIASVDAEFIVGAAPALPAAITGGGNATFELRFVPAAAGLRTGKIEIVSDAPGEELVTVNATGTGTVPLVPDLKVAPAELLFGIVTVGSTSSPMHVFLKNEGTGVLTLTDVAATPGEFRLAGIPSMPLSLPAGSQVAIQASFTPGAVRPYDGVLRITSNDPDTPVLDVPMGGTGSPPGTGSCDLNPNPAVSPQITSPTNDEHFVFGEVVTFTVVDTRGNCAFACEDVCWYFTDYSADPDWGAVDSYQFTSGRLLGCGRVMPKPGHYLVKARICGTDSLPISFTVDLDPLPTDPIHPVFGDDYPWMDWEDNEGDNHLTTAHFQIFWNLDEVQRERDTDEIVLDPFNNPIPINMQPTTDRIGLLECVWATLDHGMASPLEQGTIYREHGAYAELSRIPMIAGTNKGGGGGQSVPQGFGYSQGAANADWVPVHELFHVFDYADCPTHLKKFDDRYEANAYHFFHEGVTKVEQTLAPDANNVWGYETENWPAWAPLDLGLLELDYESGIFWSYLINHYGYAPRLSWEGPSICACAQHARARLPHNFQFFEEWYRRVRERVESALPAGVDLADFKETCPDRHFPAASYFLHNGEPDPGCLQTVEFELRILEDMVRERFPGFTAESLLVDFGVKFAQGFPPASLRFDFPGTTACGALAGLQFSHGFEPLLETTFGGVGEDDFYARIAFRIADPSVRYLRLRANDDATLYVNGRAVIGQDDPTIDFFDPDFPAASTTFADQTVQFPENERPVSNVFPVGFPTDKLFEIEWVNRADGRGNGDTANRYFLSVERYDPEDGTFTPLAADDVTILDASVWLDQGKGVTVGGQEIQLRPVSSGATPFLLPALGVLYHPVQAPAQYNGELTVFVHDDGLTHTKPSGHLMTLRPGEVATWERALAEIDDRTTEVVLDSRSSLFPAAAAYDAVPAFLLVTQRRTIHGDAPAEFRDDGTLGAIHYTVEVIGPDRYDWDPRTGEAPNNTLADAADLPFDGANPTLGAMGADQDVFTETNGELETTWSMTVADLSLHVPADVDFFRVSAPYEEGDCEELPDCPIANLARLMHGELVITLRETARRAWGADVVFYDVTGLEIARGNPLRITCPLVAAGFEPLLFAVEATGGHALRYNLEIVYTLPDDLLGGPLGRLCNGKTPDDADEPDNMFAIVDPLPRLLGREYVFGAICNTIVCQLPMHDYLLFNWEGGEDFVAQFEHAADAQFEFDLFDGRFEHVGRAAPEGRRRKDDDKSGVRQVLGIPSLPAGLYVIQVTGAVFHTPYTLRFPPSGQAFVRGDANTSGRIDIADAIFVLSYLFARGTAPSCLDTADANDDGRNDIADAIRTLTHLFAHGGPLPLPFGGCGADPTADDLSCASYPPCQR